MVLLKRQPQAVSLTQIYYVFFLSWFIIIFYLHYPGKRGPQKCSKCKAPRKGHVCPMNSTKDASLDEDSTSDSTSSDGDHGLIYGSKSGIRIASKRDNLRRLAKGADQGDSASGN